MRIAKEIFHFFLKIIVRRKFITLGSINGIEKDYRITQWDAAKLNREGIIWYVIQYNVTNGMRRL